MDNFKIFNDAVYERKIFHRVVIYMTSPTQNEILDIWLDSEEGQWLSNHCIHIEVVKHYHQYTLGYEYYITAYIKPSDYTFYTIKFST